MSKLDRVQAEVSFTSNLITMSLVTFLISLGWLLFYADDAIATSIAVIYIIGSLVCGGLQYRRFKQLLDDRINLV